VTGQCLTRRRKVAAFFHGSIEITMSSLDLPEYRSDDVGQRSPGGKAQYCLVRQLKTPLMVDDTGFFIDALKGFPGPYAAMSYILSVIPAS